MTMLFTPFAWASLDDSRLELYTAHVIKSMTTLGFSAADIRDDPDGLAVVYKLGVVTFLSVSQDLTLYNLCV